MISFFNEFEILTPLFSYINFFLFTEKNEKIYAANISITSYDNDVQSDQN
jgi:hypothetical protein